MVRQSKNDDAAETKWLDTLVTSYLVQRYRPFLFSLFGEETTVYVPPTTIVEAQREHLLGGRGAAAIAGTKAGERNDGGREDSGDRRMRCCDRGYDNTFDPTFFFFFSDLTGFLNRGPSRYRFLFVYFKTILFGTVVCTSTGATLAHLRVDITLLLKKVSFWTR